MLIKLGNNQKSIPVWLVETFLLLRGLYFIGTKYKCPCCGWKVRSFTRGGKSFHVRHHGYCPRCDAKARHRRNWLYLKNETDLFTSPKRLLHVSPRYSLSRRFVKFPNLDYVGADLYHQPNLSVRMDISKIPFSSNTIDAVICIHVLEHIPADRLAMQEIFRVLKPGGWALISVPIRLDQTTFEDSSITSPEDRRQAFGETGHYRFYGFDLIDRLEGTGFQVQLYLSEDVDQKTKGKYGLLNDENIFFCTKPYLSG